MAKVRRRPQSGSQEKRTSLRGGSIQEPSTTIVSLPNRGEPPLLSSPGRIGFRARARHAGRGPGAAQNAAARQ